MKNAMACVSLPTCGLAMAPAETYLPELMYKIGIIMDELEYPEPLKDIIVRMSGCPNGCSRPVLGEICFIGRSMEVDTDGVPHGMYDMYFGGNATGTRLATMYKKGLGEAQILAELRPMLKEYKRYHAVSPLRRFGDFAIEHGITRECKAAPTASKVRHKALCLSLDLSLYRSVLNRAFPCGAAARPAGVGRPGAGHLLPHVHHLQGRDGGGDRTAC